MGHRHSHLFRQGKNISYKIETFFQKRKLIYVFAGEGGRGGHLAIYLILKLIKNLTNGSDVRWKTIREMRPTVA